MGNTPLLAAALFTMKADIRLLPRRHFVIFTYYTPPMIHAATPRYALFSPPLLPLTLRHIHYDTLATDIDAFDTIATYHIIAAITLRYRRGADDVATCTLLSLADDAIYLAAFDSCFHFRHSQPVCV